MIDVETLGDGPTSLILSIGAVEFNPNSDLIGEGFHCYLEIDSCLKAGLTVDASTICWWMTQSEEARNIFNQQHQSLSLHTALYAFKQYIMGKSSAPIVWANGTNFDMPILENAFRKVGVATPWEYYNVRDYRTVKSALALELFEMLRVKPEVKHDAYHDALAQAQTLQKIYMFSQGREVDVVQA